MVLNNFVGNGNKVSKLWKYIITGLSIFNESVTKLRTKGKIKVKAYHESYLSIDWLMPQKMFLKGI